MKVIILALAFFIFMLKDTISDTIMYSDVTRYVNCGYAEPKEHSDCSVADLNTNFSCCFVSQIPDTDDRCALVSYAAKDLIKAEMKLANYTGGKYECSSSFVNSYIGFMIFLFALIF